MSELLPSNQTAVESAFDMVAERISDQPVPIRDVWTPQTCPAGHLPFLAWALSVDGWDEAWPEDRQRSAIAESVAIHRLKGSVGSVKRALRLAGYEGAEIVEDWGRRFYDGTVPRDGTVLRGGGGHWAEYRVIIPRAITIAQAARIRSLLAAVAPAHCHLERLDFTAAQSLRDGTVLRDGSQTYGAV